LGSMEKMTKEELDYCKKFLDYMDVDYSGDVITLTSGGNGIIMNPKTKWQKFLGHSINSVAEAVAKKLGKKIEWEEESY
jgi:hypothetical protein